MNLITQFRSAQVVESTGKNQNSILDALEEISEGLPRSMEVYCLVDDVRNKAFMCLYKEPLKIMYPNGIVSKHILGTNGEWVHVAEKITAVDIQLARLGHGSQDSH